jgi:hypothetical protein
LGSKLRPGWSTTFAPVNMQISAVHCAEPWISGAVGSIVTLIALPER